MPSRVPHLARVVLLAFVITFLAAQILVLLIMTHRIPDLYLHVRGTHVHHLNYGIFLLSGVGAVLLFGKPTGRLEELAAALYGIGLALTFDEFGMWLHLGGPYWQRASFDAVVIIGSLIALVAYSTQIARLSRRQWTAVAAIFALLAVFVHLTASVWSNDGRRLKKDLQRIEAESPA